MSSSMTPPPTMHHHTSLRILSQNLYGAEQHSPHQRAHAFASFLEALLPEVVGLQEVRRFNIAPLLASDVLRKAYPHLNDENAAEPPWTMVLTRSSPHLQRLHRKHYAGVGGWRGMELVHVNASGRLVSFASVHLSAFDCPAAAAQDDDAARNAAAVEAEATARNATSRCPGGASRAAELRTVLDILSRDGARDAVLMGDLNFGTRRDLFGLELSELRRHAEWRDAWSEAERHKEGGISAGYSLPSASHSSSGGSSGWTWDNRRNPLNKRDDEDGRKPDAPLNFPSDRIDRVLLKGGVHARSATLVNDRPLSSSSSTPLFVSDHFGVEVQAIIR